MAQDELTGRRPFPLEVAVLIGPIRIPVEVCTFTIEEFPGSTGMRMRLQEGVPMAKKIEIILRGPEQLAVSRALVALSKA